MTGITVQAVVDVAPNTTVMRIGGGLGVRVTGDAAEHGVVGGIGVAIGANRPLAGVAAGVNGELVVVEYGTNPRGCRMTAGAGFRESRGQVIRIGNGVVFV